VLGCDVGEVQPGARVAWLKLGTTELLLRPGTTTAAPDYQRAGIGLVLYATDLDATRKRLESRGLAFQGTDGSERCLTFTDPDGH